MRILILGGGSWGTALGHMFASNGHKTKLLVRNEELAEAIEQRHENPGYLPGVALCRDLHATAKADEAFDGAEIYILAVPCQFLREHLRAHAELFLPGLPVVCASKGLELASLKTMAGVVTEELPQARYGILSGPSFAAEVVKGMPTAIVLGCNDKALADKLQEVFSAPTLRVYSSNDVTGVELGGALKNIIAIAAGISDGLGFGYNSRAALITRGLAEMSRLGAAMGANLTTFMGLSGMGDLVLTCTGDLSRNRGVGMRLANGESLQSIVGSMNMVAEGVKTTEAAMRLGDKLGVDLPVTVTVQAILHGDLNPQQAVAELMTRSLKAE